MRCAIALLVTAALGAGTVGPLAPTAVASAAGASVMDQQPEAQPPQPSAAPTAQQDDADITSAGWANILWIVVVLVVGVAFVWLAMAGLRTRTRE